jgi:DNA-binding NtrC family response regulator
LLAGSKGSFLSQLQLTLSKLGCELSVAQTVSEAADVLSRLPSIGVVVCQPELPDGDWRALLEHCNKRTPSPNVILLTEAETNPEVWKELLMLGGYDTCHDIRRLESIAPEAWRRWHRCQETEVARRQNLTTIKSQKAG